MTSRQVDRVTSPNRHPVNSSSCQLVSRSLPLPLTELIGREVDVRQVIACFAASATCRLVMLTGTGGVGKTRLGLQVGEELAGDAADGAWFRRL